MKPSHSNTHQYYNENYTDLQAHNHASDQHSLVQNCTIDTSSLISGNNFSFDRTLLESQQERSTLQCFFEISPPTPSATLFNHCRDALFLLFQLITQIVK